MVAAATFLRPETLLLFLYFVVPGFVAIRAFDLVIPAERRTFDNSFVDMLAYSLFILAIWGLPFFGLVALGRYLPSVVYYLVLYLFTLFVVFVFPIYMTWVYYRARTEWPLQGRTIHPSPTSWDYFFDQGDIYWVRFHFKSGEKLGGYYGENSFATSYPSVQQVYVEEVYELEEDGSFARDPVTATSGAIVKLEDCEYIEFLEVGEQSGPIRLAGEQTSTRDKFLKLLGLDRAIVFSLDILIRYLRNRAKRR